MPKKILFESAIHQFLSAGKRKSLQRDADFERRVRAFLRGLTFANEGKGKLKVAWSHPKEGSYLVEYGKVHFYFRGDNERAVSTQSEQKLCWGTDLIQDQNQRFFDQVIEEVLSEVGL